MNLKSFGILRNRNLGIFNNVCLVLAILCLLGGLLRFYHLGYQSLWYDEFASIRYANLPLFESLTVETNHPPLHDYLLWIWIRIFGNSENSVRSLSVIFGLATIVPVTLANNISILLK